MDDKFAEGVLQIGCKKTHGVNLMLYSGLIVLIVLTAVFLKERINSIDLFLIGFSIIMMIQLLYNYLSLPSKSLDRQGIWRGIPDRFCFKDEAVSW